jgi:fatty-acyl-CoA synthase
LPPEADRAREIILQNVNFPDGPLPPPGSVHRSANKDWLRALEKTARIEGNPSRTLAHEFDDLAAAKGDAPALISEHETYSFRDLMERSNRYARWAIAHDLRPGDVVCLMMGNRAEYVAIWLGLNRVGVVVALLNTNLASGSLAHCIAIANPCHIIVANEYRTVCESALAQSGIAAKMFVHGAGNHNFPLQSELARQSGAPLAEYECRDIKLSDHALYIYTSGTTGLPKAAILTHRRIMNWCLWFSGLMDAGTDDRMFNCLPLYHSVGGVVAVWAVLLGGGSVVIRERFSAKSFWNEIVRFDCTLFQYIGELCRYLVNTPPCAEERKHRLRLCVGNGLRPDVWKRFEQRFLIPRILEFYAATEGNFSLYNVEGEPGAIGRVPSFIAHRFKMAIVKYDFECGEPQRDVDGRCIRCEPNEAGEAIAKIESNAEDGSANFEGYLNRAETQKKILCDVFARGDAWMRAGDLMRKDRRGFYYFVDRVGETFRWKGENVATTEVAQAISSCPGVIEASVYGVEVKGYDGRAGMAALAVNEKFDLAAFRRHVDARLPDYARPVFLRIVQSLEVTETFKPKKHALAAQGFDPRTIGEAVYCAGPRGDTYVRLDEALYQQIISGAFRL